MDPAIDRLAKKIFERRESRRSLIRRIGKGTIGASAAIAGAELFLEDAEAACACGGCYTIHGTSGSMITQAYPSLTVRSAPFTCAPDIGYFSCYNSLSRDHYTDEGEYICNCCGHCSSRWYQLYAGGGWVSSVFTNRNDGGCECCSPDLLGTGEGVG